MKNQDFPEDINKLIQKCEDTVDFIQSSFFQGKVAIVKDLYNVGTKVSRFEDYYIKLNIIPGENNEIKGLYIFAELDKNGSCVPIYVGISRPVF